MRQRLMATTYVVIREVQSGGVDTLSGIARVLRARGVKTPAGRGQPVQVSRLLSASSVAANHVV